jgi:hypothetical protein
LPSCARGDLIQMLNIFIHDVKKTIMSYNIGDKTNEPGCLKALQKSRKNGIFRVNENNIKKISLR